MNFLGQKKNSNLIENNISIHNKNSGSSATQTSTRKITDIAKRSSTVYIISQIMFPNNLYIIKFIKVLQLAQP